LAESFRVYDMVECLSNLVGIVLDVLIREVCVKDFHSDSPGAIPSALGFCQCKLLTLANLLKQLLQEDSRCVRHYIFSPVRESL